MALSTASPPGSSRGLKECVAAGRDFLTVSGHSLGLSFRAALWYVSAPVTRPLGFCSRACMELLCSQPSFPKDENLCVCVHFFEGVSMNILIKRISDWKDRR